ncbi:hypothetical protein Bca101_030945 [Brassica carinata]
MQRLNNAATAALGSRSREDSISRHCTAYYDLKIIRAGFIQAMPKAHKINGNPKESLIPFNETLRLVKLDPWKTVEARLSDMADDDVEAP